MRSIICFNLITVERCKIYYCIIWNKYFFFYFIIHVLFMYDDLDILLCRNLNLYFHILNFFFFFWSFIVNKIELLFEI